MLLTISIELELKRCVLDLVWQGVNEKIGNLVNIWWEDETTSNLFKSFREVK